MNYVSKMLAAFGCVALLLMGGCFFGDQVAPPRIVTLKFQTPAGQSKVSLSVADAQVQEALRLIDSVLTSDGLIRDPNPSSANTTGFIAGYAKPNSTGSRLVDNPNLYLKGDRLVVAFTEFWNRSGHLSASTQRTSNLLTKELSSRYGAARIKIE